MSEDACGSSHKGSRDKGSSCAPVFIILRAKNSCHELFFDSKFQPKANIQQRDREYAARLARFYGSVNHGYKQA